MIQDSFEAYLKSRGPYLGDPQCFSYSYEDLQEAFTAGWKRSSDIELCLQELANIGQGLDDNIQGT